MRTSAVQCAKTLQTSQNGGRGDSYTNRRISIPSSCKQLIKNQHTTSTSNFQHTHTHTHGKARKQYTTGNSLCTFACLYADYCTKCVCFGWRSAPRFFSFFCFSLAQSSWDGKKHNLPALVSLYGERLVLQIFEMFIQTRNAFHSDTRLGVGLQRRFIVTHIREISAFVAFSGKWFAAAAAAETTTIRAEQLHN